MKAPKSAFLTACNGARYADQAWSVDRVKSAMFASAVSLLYYYRYPQVIWAAEIARHLRRLCLAPDAVCVDAPSGDGIVSYWLQRRLSLRCELVDISKQAIDKILRFYPSREHLTVRRCDLMQIPSGPHHNDVWILVNSLYVLQDPAAVIAHLRPRIQTIIGVFPYLDHANYRAFCRRHPHFTNPSAMTRTQTIDFFDGQSYGLLTTRDLTFISYQKLSSDGLRKPALRLFNLVDPWCRPLSTGAYWLGLFQRK